MLLLTKEIRARLIANGFAPADHVPVVKLFNPVGAATWLFSELDEDGDTLFGLADLGFGCPEIGSASLSEIASVRLPFGLKIERDLHFETRFPISVFAATARVHGSITENTTLLEAMAAQLAQPKLETANPELPSADG